MIKILLCLACCAIGAAQGEPKTFVGQIFLRNSRFYISEKYGAIVPAYVLLLEDASKSSHLCLANRDHACPKYKITYQSSHASKLGVVLKKAKVDGVAE